MTTEKAKWLHLLFRLAAVVLLPLSVALYPLGSLLVMASYLVVLAWATRNLPDNAQFAALFTSSSLAGPLAVAGILVLLVLLAPFGEHVLGATLSEALVDMAKRFGSVPGFGDGLATEMGRLSSIVGDRLAVRFLLSVLALNLVFFVPLIMNPFWMAWSTFERKRNSNKTTSSWGILIFGVLMLVAGCRWLLPIFEFHVLLGWRGYFPGNIYTALYGQNRFFIFYLAAYLIFLLAELSLFSGIRWILGRRHA